MIITVETEDEAKSVRELFQFIKSFTIVTERRGRFPNYLMYILQGRDTTEPLQTGDVRRLEEWFPELMREEIVVSVKQYEFDEEDE